MTIHEVIDTASKLNKILSNLNSQRTAVLEMTVSISKYRSSYSGNFRSFDELKAFIEDKIYEKDIQSTILDNIEKLDFNFEEENFDEDYRYTSGVVLRTKVNQEVRVSINLDL